MSEGIDDDGDGGGAGGRYVGPIPMPVAASKEDGRVDLRDGGGEEGSLYGGGCALWELSEASEFFRERGLIITAGGGTLTSGRKLGVGGGRGDCGNGRDRGISGRASFIAQRVRQIVERGWRAVRGGLRVICLFSQASSIVLMPLSPFAYSSLSRSENQPRQLCRFEAGLPSQM